MNCPDIDRLIEHQMGQSSDPELTTHLKDCPTCRADFETIRVLSEIAAKDEGISEERIALIICSLPKADEPNAFRGKREIHAGVTWILGFLTAVGSMAATGVLGTAGMGTGLPLAISFGVVCILTQLHSDKDSDSPDPKPLDQEPA